MKFNIITLGCKVNAYESNYMSESLVNNGFLFCEDNSLCDVIIINTCTVTDTSDKKSLKLVRRVKRENPNALLIVCGCSTQNDISKYENLDINIILGNKDKSHIVDIIKSYKKPICNISKDRFIPFEDMLVTKFDQVRAYMKIQDGCNNFCSYCIIPFVRGDIRSKNYAKTIEEATILAKNGYKEIVLTGIHTGTYFDSGKDLCDLIGDLSHIEGIKRIRLSSVEITELNDKFMDLLKNNSILCDHLHIPLQAGSNEILKVMNRKYDTDYFENKINLIRSIRPEIAITTDVIVGHNYETDELFEECLKFCEKINFAKIHVFPYSKRMGTKSSRMPNEVPEAIKHERTKRLIALSKKQEKDYYNKFIGRTLPVLIEQTKDGKSFGHTSNYLMVTINEELEVNKIYEKEIK